MGKGAKKKDNKGGLSLVKQETNRLKEILAEGGQVIEPTVYKQSEVYLWIRRKKTTLCLQVAEDSTLTELKLRIAGIFHKSSDKEVKLFRNDVELFDEKEDRISFFDLTAARGSIFTPITLGVIFQTGPNEWEPLDIVPYSQVQEIPESVKHFLKNDYLQPEEKSVEPKKRGRKGKGKGKGGKKKG